MHTLRTALRWVSGAVGLMGLTLICGSVPSGAGWISWPESFVAPGAALTIGGLTTLIAQLGLETVVDKRAAAVEAATRQNRSRVYEDVLGHVVESFAGKQTLTEAQVRSRAITWASSETMAALTEWFRYASAHNGQQAAPADLGDRYELVYRLSRSMRRDIAVADVSKDDLLQMLFEAYDPANDNPSAVTHGTVDRSGSFVRAPLDGGALPQRPSNQRMR